MLAIQYLIKYRGKIEKKVKSSNLSSIIAQPKSLKMKFALWVVSILVKMKARLPTLIDVESTGSTQGIRSSLSRDAGSTTQNLSMNFIWTVGDT